MAVGTLTVIAGLLLPERSTALGGAFMILGASIIYLAGRTLWFAVIGGFNFGIDWTFHYSAVVSCGIAVATVGFGVWHP